MKRTILNISALALIAGAILTSCNTADKKIADAGATSADSTNTSSTSTSASSAGNTMTADTTAMPKTRPKMDKAKVPAAVTQLFYSEYPQATVANDNWYGYPAFDYSNDWYDYDPDLYTNDNPDAYVIDFTTDSVRRRVMYTKAGRKVASHMIMTSALPAPVLAAIGTSSYSSWALGTEKEMVFKNKDSDKSKVYKVSVKNGMERHVLYYDPTGKLIKDKKMA